VGVGIPPKGVEGGQDRIGSPRDEAFRLVTPDWTASLPGWGYDGGHPESFMCRDERPEARLVRTIGALMQALQADREGGHVFDGAVADCPRAPRQ
jgi:hypothetical protein